MNGKDTGGTITDFQQGTHAERTNTGHGDKIDLTALGAHDFVGVLSEAGAVGTGQVGFMNNVDGTTTVFVDIDGVSGADLEITLAGTFTLAGSDFILASPPIGG